MDLIGSALFHFIRNSLSIRYESNNASGAANVHSPFPAIASASLVSANSVPFTTDRRRTGENEAILNFLNKFTTDDQRRSLISGEDSNNDEEEQKQAILLQRQEEEDAKETREEFEQKKRQLMLMLDQAQMNKMKITKAFGDKLKKVFGPNEDFSRFGLNWHPGWREPDRYVPEVLDADPYRGACSVTSCACDLFQSWPMDTNQKSSNNFQLFVYNPKFLNSETDLCFNCHHAKIDHTLKSSGKTTRNALKEFSPDNMDKYAIQYRADVPKKHPADIPLYELEKFYEKNPEYPGASPNAIKMMVMPEDEQQNKKSGMAMMSEAPFGDDDDDLLEEDGL